MQYNNWIRLLNEADDTVGEWIDNSTSDYIRGLYDAGQTPLEALDSYIETI